MKTVNFIFGIHNHQPVGNFDRVIEDAYRRSYLPFIEVLEAFPDIHISLHYSGCLLEWLEEKHPEFIERIVSLVKRGNVEILSGGFYEPILAMIPERDRVGQIEMMNKYIKNRFGYVPEGLWLTERVWEPDLPRAISEAGIKYVAVDDYHFLSNGFFKDQLTGYFVTEDSGKKVGIFPISQDLRYAIPFKDPEFTVEYLKSYATDDGSICIVMADDGEKFGVWPGTYRTAYEEKWLERFFELLVDNKDWLKLRTFSEYYNTFSPRGRVYLPTASYFEMSEWSLPWKAGEKFSELIEEFSSNGRLDEIKPFLKGGMWRNFLSKYPESNWMQKKMLYLSDTLHALGRKNLSKYELARLQEARKHLWRGMCNCAYWHGVFGGLYLPHLRDAIYNELIACEKIIRGLDKEGCDTVRKLDIDCDGREEIILCNEKFTVVVSPSRGGIIEELSFLEKKVNILNTMSRYREAYHRKLKQAQQVDESELSGSIHDILVSKEKDLDKYLYYDRYPRKMLVDHFIKPDVSLEGFVKGEYYEDSDFIGGGFSFRKRGKSIVLTRDGWVNWKRFRIKKVITIEKTGVFVEYTLENTDTKENSFRFGVEFNFAMSRGDSADAYYLTESGEISKKSLNFTGKLRNLKKVSILDESREFSVILDVGEPMEFWMFPVETVSISESGFEKVYQSSVVIPWLDVVLKPGCKRKIAYSLSIFTLS